MSRHDADRDALSARFIPWTIVTKFREINSPIMQRGKAITSYRAPVITEYVDTLTGEILPATELTSDKELWPVIHASERCMQREFILNSLRPEVQEFALFILRFRNQRRGVTPCFGQLAKWYAELKGKRTDNVRRYFNPLERAGIIAGESLLGTLFQIAGKSITAREHMSEDSNSYSKIALIQLRQRDIAWERENDNELASLKCIAQTDASFNAASFPLLPAHIRAVINRYVQEHPEGQFA